MISVGFIRHFIVTVKESFLYFSYKNENLYKETRPYFFQINRMNYSKLLNFINKETLTLTYYHTIFNFNYKKYN